MKTEIDDLLIEVRQAIMSELKQYLIKPGEAWVCTQANPQTRLVDIVVFVDQVDDQKIQPLLSMFRENARKSIAGSGWVPRLHQERYKTVAEAGHLVKA